eukprot:CAMPEP_0172486686 /NCGR_PEP_ID=MMETSP1066-20121228/15355_1 /TAXON_ID=671091 /ORGANISM="Coscinodiscus wailesii, Strain CCMP2513" /LENGTH=311 /DNA_ID=CAMNT_0013252789 /DNA_START=55 /DNA_END=990 /DNA_ORIENTATION=+
MKSLSIFYIFYTATNFVLSLESTKNASKQHCSTAASQFKAPNENTPLELSTKWRSDDEALWSYVASHVPAVLEHTGSSDFDEHLKGVQSVLRFWGASDHLTSAGLFHSIYGTEGFQGFSLPLSERSAIRNLIGAKAEKLAFVFCMVDRSTVDRTVFDWKPGLYAEDTVLTFRARPELGRFEITLAKDEWLDFIELTLADWLEQVEGAAAKPSEVYRWNEGEAYSYRRTAYKKMSELLAAERHPRLTEVAPRMLREVMATEGEGTRHLVQVRTPPQSRAAADAFVALRAVGEDIPEDFAPRSLQGVFDSEVE